MSLIKCSKCGKEISDKTNICPYCGYENQSKSKISYSSQLKTGSIVSLISCSIIIISILSNILMGYYMNPSNTSKPSGNVTITINLTNDNNTELTDFFGISLILTIPCFVLIILFLVKKIKHVKLYKFLLLSMAIIQLICAIISIGTLLCCGFVYSIFSLINVIGAIIVATSSIE